MRTFEWGDLVMIEKGPYKGEVGCYDDDADEEEEIMIVYLALPCLSKCVQVRAAWVRKASKKEERLWKHRVAFATKRLNDGLARTS